MGAGLRAGPRRFFILLTVVLASLVPATSSLGAARGDATAAKAAAIAARNESLRRELELAGGDDFYLILDAEASVLTLMYKGAPLRETRVRSAEVGERARHGGDDAEAIDLHALWSGGTLEPPRVDVREEVLPPQPGRTPSGGPLAGAAASTAPQGEFLSGEEPASRDAAEAVEEEEVEIPKTPEELYPVPLSYEIRFAEGLTVEVVRAAADSVAATGPGKERVGGEAGGGQDLKPAPAAPGPSLWERLGHFVRRLTLERPEGERARLRIVIDPLDADRLFRSLPPDVKLLIRRPSAGS